MPRLLRRLLLLALPFALVGCAEVKSSNPLSPTVAGPMAGVSVSIPAAIAPAVGLKVEDTEQPIALVIKNPETNSARPVTVGLQVAFDANFQNVAFSREGLTPDPSGLTSVRVDRLPTGRTYYWRTKADDGANDSGWSPALYLEVLNPIAIGTPNPKVPVGGARASSSTPDLVATNGQSSGPYSLLKYQYQVSDSQTFANLVVNGEIYEDPAGETHFVTPAFTTFDTLFFWRVRASDGKHTGNWSRVESFKTTTAPVIAPIPSPVGGSSGGGGGGSLNVTACNSLVGDKPALSKCIHDTINPGGNADLAFEVTKRIAWALRGEGAGLLIKNGGENTIPWKGYSFSLSRICYPDGHIWKVLSDAGPGGTNGTTWSDNDFVDRSLYVPAINPD